MAVAAPRHLSHVPCGSRTIGSQVGPGVDSHPPTDSVGGCPGHHLLLQSILSTTGLLFECIAKAKTAKGRYVQRTVAINLVSRRAAKSNYRPAWTATSLKTSLDKHGKSHSSLALGALQGH